MLARKAGVLLVFIAALGLTGCSGLRSALSNAKHPPDEFAVYQRPPLSLPPDYGLRPPEPGKERPAAYTPSEQAESAMLNRPVQRQDLGPATPGLQDLLQETGANKADPNIRQEVDQETLALSDEDKRLIDKLIFWVDDKQYPGTVVDAAKEQRRLLETQALGQPINKGKTPQIVRETPRKGILPF